MIRRVSSLVAVLAVLLLAFPTAALAYQTRVIAPDEPISATTEVRIRVVPEGLETTVTRLQVRTEDGDGDWQPTRCVARCDRLGDRTYAFDLDPELGPFAGIRPNGPLELQLRAAERTLGDPQRLPSVSVAMRLPATAPRQLAATVDGQTVRLSWKAAPEPDVTGYRVERIGSAKVTTLAPSATTATDTPGPGDHRYRVVTLRDSGDGATLETPSSPVSVEVAPEPAPPTSGSGGGGDRGGASGGGSGSDGARDADAPDLDADGGGDDRTAGRDRSPATASQRSTTRTGRSPARTPDFSFEGHRIGIPAIPTADDVFRGELDYGALEPQAGDGRGDDGDGDGSDVADDEVVLSTPGRSGGTFLGRLTDPDRVAVPIAGGLLLTAIGLHLWRWLKIPLI